MNRTTVVKYFLAGATSELGNRVARSLVDEFGPERVICLVRKTSDPASIRRLTDLGVGIVTGDVLAPDSISGHLNGQTAYIDMTHPKYYAASLAPIIESGVKRVFFITTTGLFSGYNSCSEIYIDAENRIKASGLTYTILRPSMIYGTERDRNMTRLLKYLHKYPLFPVFGDGLALMQPVHVQDLADGIVSAIRNDALTRGKEYNLCGPRAITYLELIKTACDALCTKIALIHVPYGMAVAVAGVMEKLPAFPIKKEQVMRLAEDKCFDISPSIADLGYNPRDFSRGIREEIHLLRERGIIN